MPDLEAIEVLTQAKERLFECGWGTGTHMNRADRGDLATLCLEEAVMGERGFGGYIGTLSSPAVRRVEQYLRTATGTPDNRFMFQWNDRQQHASSIFDAIDDAILIAKGASVVAAPS